MIITASKSLLPTIPIFEECAIVIRGGTILTVGPKESILKRHTDREIYHLKNALILPGLVNVHTHLELPALLDIIRAETFPDWILKLIRTKKKLDKKKYVSAAHDNIGLLKKTGTTTIGEICTHGISPDLLKQSGLRGVIFHETISMNPASPLRHLVSPASHRSSLIHTGISPHTSYTVSEAALKQIKKISENKNFRLCMHIAESKDEIKLLQRKDSGLDKLYQLAGWQSSWAPTGSSSFEYLNRIGFLCPNLLAVHAVQVDDSDIALIKKTKTAVAHCPRSNKELGVGRMPLKKFLDAGITVGLGTDSLASVASLNMWDEMRYALKIHKKDGITARDIFEIATIGGAKALGLDKEIGTIEPGKKADIIAVPLPSKNTGDIYSNVLRETKLAVMTIVNGKILHLAPDVSTDRGLKVSY